MDGKKVMYRTNQYSKGKIMIVKDISHSLVEDTIHGRYFVMNLNNQIVYLDQFKEEAVVELENQENIKVDFSKVNIESKDKITSQHTCHFFKVMNYRKE